tara:strand:+ start:99 stop:419 length:321 start_codon:yes stop_codon:yes gene_type:complete
MIVGKWARAFNTGDVEALLAQYHPNAILVPTLSSKILTNQHTRLRYFTDLLVNKRATVEVTNYIMLGGVESGFYVFRLADGTTVQARFTISPYLGKIGTHHSSVVP